MPLRLHRLFRKALALPIPELWLLARVAVLLLLLRLALHALPFRVVLRAMDALSTPGERPARGSDYQRRVVWAVTAAGRQLLGNKPCLPQALGTRLLLRRRGLGAQLRIGVARGPGGRLEAHAWVENGERIIIGGSDSPRFFTPLPTFDHVPQQTA